MRMKVYLIFCSIRNVEYFPTERKNGRNFTQANDIIVGIFLPRTLPRENRRSETQIKPEPSIKFSFERWQPSKKFIFIKILVEGNRIILFLMLLSDIF